MSTRLTDHLPVARRAACLLAIAAFARILLAASPVETGTSFTAVNLGTLENGGWSEAVAMNDSGQAVGWSWYDSAYVPHAFSWTPASGKVDLSPGARGRAEAVNSSGQVVGWRDAGIDPQGYSMEHAFSWTQAGGMVDLGTLGGSDSFANAVNDSGQVVGSSDTAGDAARHAFLWTQAGGMVDLDTLGNSWSNARAVNNSGQVVGNMRKTAGGALHAFSWTQAGGMKDLGTLGGSESDAWAVNDSGQVVGNSRTAEDVPGAAVDHAFSWTEAGGMKDLGTLGGTISYARAVNTSGRVVGWAYLAGNNTHHAFSWTEAGGMVDLGTLGGTSSQARAVNDSGQVVGWADVVGQYLGNDIFHAFSWTEEGGMVDLGVDDGCNHRGVFSDAFAVNGSGQVAGLINFSGIINAVLWNRGPDTTPPSVSITAHPTDPTKETSASFSFSAIDPDNDPSPPQIGFHCTLDGVTPLWWCTSPATYFGLADGRHTFLVTATDCAQNTSAPATFSWLVDTMPPSISIAKPVDGASYLLGQVVSASYACTDGGSEVASCLGTVPSGSPIDTGSSGPMSFTVNASDVAGNTSSQAAHYSVVYPFSGFFAPVDNPPTINVANAGSVIPVKFSLGGNYGLAILQLGYPASEQISCDALATQDDVDQLPASTTSGLTYDSSSNQYVYLWRTDKAWAGTCRRLTVRLNDGTGHPANFKLR